MNLEYDGHSGRRRRFWPLTWLLTAGLVSVSIYTGFWITEHMKSESDFWSALRQLGVWIAAFILFVLLPVSYLEQTQRIPRPIQRFSLYFVFALLGGATVVLPTMALFGAFDVSGTLRSLSVAAMSFGVLVSLWRSYRKGAIQPPQPTAASRRG